jgi:hypothetical protein
MHKSNWVIGASLGLLLLAGCNGAGGAAGTKGTSGAGGGSAPAASGTSGSAANGTGVKGPRTGASSCDTGFVWYLGTCYAATQSCSVGNGGGTESFSQGAYGACSATSCNSGFTLYSGGCFASTQSCSVANGTGTQSFANGSYGACAAASCNAGYALRSGACVASAASDRFLGAVDLGNGHKDLLFQDPNGDLEAWIGIGGYDFGVKVPLTFGGRMLSSWNPAGTSRFVGAYDLGNGHADLLFQEANGDIEAWIGNGGYDFGVYQALTFGGRKLSAWNPAATSRFVGAYDLGNGHADLLFQEANGDIEAWMGNGGYDFGVYQALTFGGRKLSAWNPAATSRFVGAYDLGNGHADLLFQEANGDIEAWVGNGGADFGVYQALTFGGRKLSAWNPAATSRFVGAADLGNGHSDLLFQEGNGDLDTWIGGGGFDFGVHANLTFGGLPLSRW